MYSRKVGLLFIYVMVYKKCNYGGLLHPDHSSIEVLMFFM